MKKLFFSFQFVCCWLAVLASQLCRLVTQAKSSLGKFEATSFIKIQCLRQAVRPIGHRQQRAHVYQFSRPEIGDKAERLIKRYIATKKCSACLRSYLSSDGLRIINVAVARSDRPVHFLLTSHAGVLWNFQKSDTAKISGISVIGPNGAGRANLLHGTTDQGSAGRFLSSCTALPARTPKEH